MSQQIRPIMSGGKLGVGSFGVAIMPDGTPDSLRTVIKPDGFHFEPYDFDDLVLPYIRLQSPNGLLYSISFDDTGVLLINGAKYISPTNQLDETIAGDKTLTGLTFLSGGLQLKSPNGTKYNLVVDDNGAITAVKGV